MSMASSGDRSGVNVEGGVTALKAGCPPSTQPYAGEVTVLKADSVRWPAFVILSSANLVNKRTPL